MSQQRRTFTAQQKADTVRRHLWDKVPVSDLAEELKVQPTQIHQWVQQAKLQMEQLFQRTSGGRSQAKAADSKDQEIAKLKAKLVQKHEVISELMEENVKAKKANGDL
jgi:transposase-like protein